MFATISSTIPRNWDIQLDTTGSLHIAPQSWLRPDYWEEYFDNPRDGDAAETFKREVDIILREDAPSPE